LGVILLVNREIILSRIDKVNQYVSFLKGVSKYSVTQFISDPLIYGSTERFLHLAIESVLDIGNHIIADRNYQKPESNKQIFEILHQNQVIDTDLLPGLSRMAQFRNILVHDYMKLDREVVYNVVTTNLSDFEQFVQSIVKQL